MQFNMKRSIITFLLALSFFTFPMSVFAQGNNGGAKTIDLGAKVKVVGEGVGFNSEQTLASTVGLIINVLISIIGVLFMIYAVYAGYLWMTARGDDEQVSKAKAILRGSIIGIIIVLASYAITAFVVSRVITATGYTVEQNN